VIYGPGATPDDIEAGQAWLRAEEKKLEDLGMLSELVGFREAIFIVEGMNQQQRDSYDADVAAILKRMKNDLCLEDESSNCL
jgi:hypothetical protein